MKRSTKFLHRIRIRGGEFDASARAMHREAAIGNVPSATIERTNMSTKTTLKRVSLVAVAALGFGLLSVVPSSATSQSDTLTLSAATSSVANGVAATINVTQTFIGLQSDTMTVTASLVSSPAGNAAVPVLAVLAGSTINAATPLLNTTGLIVATTDTGSATTYTQATSVMSATLTGTVAGTYVIKFTPQNYAAAIVSPYTTLTAASQSAALAAVVTWTVTVGAATAATADTTSTSWIAAGSTTVPTAATDLLAVATGTITAGTQAAAILVTPKLAGAAASVALGVTISGPGTLGLGTTLTQPSQGRALTGAVVVGTQYVTVWSDGTSGVATITISSGSTVLSTETVSFYGAITTITATLVNSVVAVGSTGVSNIGAITAVAKDANGTVVPAGTLYANSDTVGVISNAYSASAIGGTTAGVATFTLTGVAVGTAKITIGNGSTALLTTVSSAASAVRVGLIVPTTVAVTFDKTTYLVGGAATVTVTLLDASGNALPNGTYPNIFSATGLVSNFGLGGVALPTTGITTVLSTGAATFAVTMPVYGADVILSATGGLGLPVAAQVALTSPTVSVTSPSADAATAASNAATDAANAATDAANYAADAADAATTAAEEATAAAVAAQDSADAASAAVVALGIRVSAVYTALRAQITSLTKLIVRITKKIKA